MSTESSKQWPLNSRGLGIWGIGVVMFLLLSTLAGAQTPPAPAAPVEEPKKEEPKQETPKAPDGLFLKIIPVQSVFIIGREMEIKCTIMNIGKDPIEVEVPSRYTVGLTMNDRPLEKPEEGGGEKVMRTLRRGEFFGMVVDVSPLVTAAFKEDGWATFAWTFGGKASDNKFSIMVMKDYAVEMETNYGTMTLEFFPEVAPNHVLNFVTLARSGFYDRKTFHRIIKGFMMQGGCPRGDGSGGTNKTIKGEFSDKKHVAGTLSMARKQDPDSADCQFFICFADLPRLDGIYTVFGQVSSGMDVVKKIEQVKTDHPDGVAFGDPQAGCGRLHLDKPATEVVIKKMTVTEKKKGGSGK